MTIDKTCRRLNKIFYHVRLNNLIKHTSKKTNLLKRNRKTNIKNIILYSRICVRHTSFFFPDNSPVIFITMRMYHRHQMTIVRMYENGSRLCDRNFLVFNFPRTKKSKTKKKRYV